MLVHILFLLLTSWSGASTIRIVMDCTETLGKDDQFGARNLVLLDCLADNHFRNPLTFNKNDN